MSKRKEIEEVENGSKAEEGSDDEVFYPKIYVLMADRSRISIS